MRILTRPPGTFLWGCPVSGVSGAQDFGIVLARPELGEQAESVIHIDGLDVCHIFECLKYARAYVIRPLDRGDLFALDKGPDPNREPSSFRHCTR